MYYLNEEVIPTLIELIDSWNNLTSSVKSRQSFEWTHKLKIKIARLATTHKRFSVFDILECLK